jgi:hypothetical protein
MALDLFEEHVYDINGAHGVSLGLPPALGRAPVP